MNEYMSGSIQRIPPVYLCNAIEGIFNPESLSDVLDISAARFMTSSSVRYLCLSSGSVFIKGTLPIR